MSGELLIGGMALLLLMGGKKKKSSKSASKKDSGTDDGSSLDEPTKEKTSGGGGSGGGSKGGGKGAPSNLAKDAIWVSPDCKKVVYGDGTGEAFWKRKGLPVAQKFIAAKYHDPYEIAKLMVTSMAPCVIEFPITEDGHDPMEEEFLREMFNRDFKEVYYLVQFLHDKISELMEREQFIIEFDERCDVVFVGEKWLIPVAERMARFYVNYMYPAATDYPDHSKKFIAWPLADVDESKMLWWDNVATAIINRMDPECGIAIVNAFKKEPFSAKSFFSTRPGLSALYESLTSMISDVQDQQAVALDFKGLMKI